MRNKISDNVALESFVPSRVAEKLLAWEKI